MFLKFEFPATCLSEAKIPPTGVVAWQTCPPELWRKPRCGCLRGTSLPAYLSPPFMYAICSSCPIYFQPKWSVSKITQFKFKIIVVMLLSLLQKSDDADDVLACKFLQHYQKMMRRFLYRSQVVYAMSQNRQTNY